MTDELNLVVLINPMVIYDGKFHFRSKTLEEGSHAPRSWQDEKTSFSKLTIYSSQKPAKTWPQRQFFLSCCQENQHFGFCDMKIWHKSLGLLYSVECRNITIDPLNLPIRTSCELLGKKQNMVWLQNCHISLCLSVAEYPDHNGDCFHSKRNCTCVGRVMQK